MIDLPKLETLTIEDSSFLNVDSFILSGFSSYNNS